MRVHEVRDFSKRGEALPIPNLIDVQIESYQKFLQKEVEPTKRKNEGLEALLREVFPIESYDGNLRLEYISYDLSEPLAFDCSTGAHGQYMRPCATRLSASPWMTFSTTSGSG